MKGLFIPDITAEMFRNGCLESIEALMAEGKIYDIDYSPWIPCSERLPEVGSQVIVCYEFKKKRYIYIADFYGDGKFHGLDDEYLTTQGRKYRKAVAWMPLPTPYRSEIPTGVEVRENE
jgi:hypothetical protein